MGGETISAWVTVEATKASQIGKKMISMPMIISTWVIHSARPRFLHHAGRRFHRGGRLDGFAHQ